MILKLSNEAKAVFAEASKAESFDYVGINRVIFDNTIGAFSPSWSVENNVFTTDGEFVDHYRKISNDELDFCILVPGETAEFEFRRVLLEGIFRSQVFVLGSIEYSESKFKAFGREMRIFFSIGWPDVWSCFTDIAPISYENLLTSEFMKNPFWVTLTQAIALAMRPSITNPIALMTQDAGIIDRQPRKRALAMLAEAGLNVLPDSMTDHDIERLGVFAGLYFPGQNSKEFNHFLSYILNTRLEIIQLWAVGKDRYQVMEEEPGGDPVWSGGAWWPTTHVAIYYDLEQSDLSEDKLTKLFYALAPIELVIDRIRGKVSGVITMYMGVAGFVEDSLYGELDMTNPPPPVDHCACGEW